MKSTTLLISAFLITSFAVAQNPNHRNKQGEIRNKKINYISTQLHLNSDEKQALKITVSTIDKKRAELKRELKQLMRNTPVSEMTDEQVTTFLTVKKRLTSELHAMDTQLYKNLSAKFTQRQVAEFYQSEVAFRAQQARLKRGKGRI